jgi:hypothetical protein
MWRNPRETRLVSGRGFGSATGPEGLMDGLDGYTMVVLSSTWTFSRLRV